MQSQTHDHLLAAAERDGREKAVTKIDGDPPHQVRCERGFDSSVSHKEMEERLKPPGDPLTSSSLHFFL